MTVRIIRLRRALPLFVSESIPLSCLSCPICLPRIQAAWNRREGIV